MEKETQSHELTYDLIKRAVCGEQEALEEILLHYDAYINWMIETKFVLDTLEKYRSVYRDTSDVNKKNHLLTMDKRLLPEGFMQKRTWDTNYQELRTMYFQRQNHRLKEEWCNTFCKWVESLPYANELILYHGE